MRLLLSGSLLLLLAGCGQAADDPDLGGVTPDQAAELNDAAAMLDANSVSAAAVSDTPAVNEDEP